MAEPRFLADEMLGTLARWLRMMGYDTVYARDLLDREVLGMARAEGRILLTRDRQLAERARDGGLLVTTDVLEEQLEQVIAAFGLREDRPMTRCTKCNGRLETVGREAVAGRVPERVLAIRTEFYLCPKCGQIYWKGTHWDNIERRLERLRNPKDGSSPR
jgi:uncharacterized protein with PIN domain